jgi:aryl-alcohol dehydrogenase-like predicted oxidoreductase
MQTRPLGRTSLQVSEICLGTMTYGQQTDAADAFAQMDYAVAHGVNFFDTAELYSIPPRAETYGATEKIIGDWFAARKNRDQIILATKAVGRTAMPWFRNDETARLDRKNIFFAVEGSLKRLRTDYIDLYQLHWPDRPMALFDSNSNAYSDHGGPDGVSFEETLSALNELVQQGKIRHFGV